MSTKKSILYLFLLSIITAFFLLKYLGDKVSPIVYRYVNVEVKRFASNVVNHSINDIIAEDLDEELFYITKNEKNEVEMLDYNTKKVNEILSQITKEIQQRLINLEDGKSRYLNISDSFKASRFSKIKNGILCEIPSGSLKNNSLFVNIGPTIPIKMIFLGQVQTSLKTKITNYGINNLVIETIVHVEVEEQVSMPAMSKKSTIKIDAPLTMKIIQGVVPDYYSNGINTNSSEYSLPIYENS